MLQRIQTVYLLIIVALTMAMMFMPLASIQQFGDFFIYGVNGIVTAGFDNELVYPTWGLFALLAVIAMVAMITIFLYKRRILQIRLCIFNGLLMLGFYGLFWFFYWSYAKEVGAEVSMTLKIAMAFPLISLILDYLAIRNIGADEALVRSLERLR